MVVACAPRCRPCSINGDCCEGHGLPAIIAWEVIAVTGGCGSLLGESGTLTETSPSIWTGDGNSCSGPMTVACAANGCELIPLSVASCPSDPSQKIQLPITCSCNPFYAEYTFPAGAFDLLCTPCCGFGVGGSYTIALMDGT